MVHVESRERDGFECGMLLVDIGIGLVKMKLYRCWKLVTHHEVDESEMIVAQF